ncbi:apses transcription factor-like protein [Cryomyces antarcticus]
MSQRRPLPEARNPLLEPQHTPQIEILVERRRLGQTDLSVKPGLVGTSNATRTDHLGKFDYAHLRVPLPHDLKGSGIFTLQKNSAYPESYFLMRRSTDGHISATGMFKAAFPWASLKEEEAERKYVKSLPTTSHDEVAGNVWISPASALELAEEYGMLTWIEALLDPEPIVTHDPKKEISTPPKFLPPSNGTMTSSQGGLSTRARSLRSASPSKASSSRKIATPRKTRAAKGSASAKAMSAAAKDIELQSASALDRANELVGTSAEPSEDGDASENVRVEATTTVEINADGEEIKITRAVVEMPPNHPDLPLPNDTEGMIAKAKEMVEEANRLQGTSSSSKRSSKRKAEELEEDDEADAASELQPSKRVRIEEMKDELKIEKVKSRALLGFTVTLAIGALIPYVF